MTQPKAGSALECILGKRLDAVCFVLNYITFQFDDFGLAALAAPLVAKGEEALSSDWPGYRDALCSQIGQTVISVSETTKTLEITLTTGTKIIVPLDAAFPPGPEMATLSGKGRFINAWLRPSSAR
jgi:hypothetical protein